MKRYLKLILTPEEVSMLTFALGVVGGLAQERRMNNLAYSTWELAKKIIQLNEVPKDGPANGSEAESNANAQGDGADSIA